MQNNFKIGNRNIDNYILLQQKYFEDPFRNAKPPNDCILNR